MRERIFLPPRVHSIVANMNTAQMTEQILAAPGWNQSKLATRLGVSQGTISRWMAGTDPEGANRDALRNLHAEIVGDATVDELGLDAARKEVMAKFDAIQPEAVPVVLEFLGLLAKLAKR